MRKLVAKQKSVLFPSHSGKNLLLNLLFLKSLSLTLLSASAAASSAGQAILWFLFLLKRTDNLGCSIFKQIMWALFFPYKFAALFLVPLA